MATATYFPAYTLCARARLTSDLVMAGDIGFITGMLPIGLQNDQAALAESVEAQTLAALGNMEAVLAPHGMSRNNVVSVTVHVTQFKRFHARVDEAYAGFFKPDRLPGRSLVGVEHLPRGALVSLDFIVHRG